MVQVGAPQNAGTFLKSPGVHQFDIRSILFEQCLSLLVNLNCIKVHGLIKKYFFGLLFLELKKHMKMQAPLRMLVGNFSNTF